MISADEFFGLAEDTFKQRRADEHMILALRAEQSDFIRINQSKVRQLGLVDEAQLSLEMFVETSKGLKKTSRNFNWRNDRDENRDRIKSIVAEMRSEAAEIPIDPFAELPIEAPSLSQKMAGRLLPAKEVLQEILEPLAKVDAAGLYAGGKNVRALTHSGGLRHWFENESFSWDYSLYTESQRAVKAGYAGSHWDVSSYAKVVETSKASLAALNVPAVTVPRGKHRVYLAPAAVNEILGMWSWGCVGESAMRNGESPLLRLRSGAAELSKQFSLNEDFRSGLVPRFNQDGELAPEVMPIIESGQLRSTIVSRRSAKEFGVKSTAGSSSETLRAPHILPGHMSEDDVLKELHEGLYLSNLHYLNWSDQPAGRLTGMTRFACFKVERGKLVAPIESMRFDDTLFEVFGAALEALTRRNEWIPETSTYDMRSVGGASTPGLLLKSFQLTI